MKRLLLTTVAVAALFGASSAYAMDELSVDIESHGYHHGVASTPTVKPDGTKDQDQPFVYGNAGTAVGAGASVDVYVPTVPAVSPSCSDGSDPSDGTCLGGAVYDPGSAEIPAHWEKVNDGTAIGANTSVQHDHSTALGAGAKSTNDHQVTLGTEDDTVKAPGIASKKSKDRQTDGDIEIVTSDQGGNLATDGGRTFSRIGSLEADNIRQWDAINANTDTLAQHNVHLNKLDKGLAVAMSLPDAWLSDTKSFGVFGSVGGYNGETAIGFAAIGRLNETWSLNAKLGADTSFDEIGWQVGAGAQW